MQQSVCNSHARQGGPISFACACMQRSKRVGAMGHHAHWRLTLCCRLACRRKLYSHILAASSTALPSWLLQSESFRYTAEPMGPAHCVYMTTRHMTQRIRWSAITVYFSSIGTAAASAAALLVSPAHGRLYYDGSMSPNGWQVLAECMLV